ncbi:MAG: endonuclease domain-containing protein [Ruminococcus sp.]|nr:endonuclease domain-containing protein [Ruminococcus sp.]
MYENHQYLDRNKHLEARARELRKNATKEEKHLWYDFLKKQPVHFYRQYIIDNYIVDFFCPKAKLIIELDGSQHYDSDEALEYDSDRTRKLEKFGFKVLRFTNREIKINFNNVCEHIYQITNARLKE